ncbi:MAG: CinA family protein [Rhodospirillales bacterium]|nr:CinA family protein [Rhodospirillales bacterium]MBO6786648.1 CinA family protein [Rhodospirillales bacterium]
MEKQLTDAADALLNACRGRGWTIATAESCTGGMVAAALTAIAGSSGVMDRGFVTYTNEAKNEMIGVPMDLFTSVGAVSEEVACAMAEGAVKTAAVDLACGITGVAGPGGGSVEKPVGLVHIAVASPDKTIHERCQFDGDRHAVRLASALKALEMMRSLADG